MKSKEKDTILYVLAIYIYRRIINEAYHSYKPDNRYPIVVLNIEVDTTLVDVNIHPTKMDVKFSKQENLNQLVFNMIREKISEKTLIPHIEKVTPTIKVEEQVLNFDVEDTKDDYELEIDFDTPNDNVYEELIINEDLICEKEEEYVLHDDIKERIPIMYPVGQVHGTYIICQNENGMYIIDQHAAKERVNYEIVKDKLMHRKNENINLLVPINIEYTNDEFIVLKENLDFLRDLNFDILKLFL